MELVELSKISHTISKGTTPTTLGYDFTKSGVPFLRAEDVTNDVVKVRNVAFHISPKIHDLLSRSKLQAGDFLITIAGTLGRVGYVPANSPPLNCNQAIAFARLDSSKVDLKYLFLICQSFDVMKTLLEEKKVGTIGNLNLEQVGNLQIPLPKPHEQKRIAAILDKADRLRRQCQFAEALSDSFLQSVFYKMFGEHLKEDFAKTDLIKLVTITGGGTPSREVQDYFKGKIAWLTAKDMKGDYIFDTEEHITEQAIKDSATKLVPKGSILIVVKSKVLMHRLPIAISEIPVCHGQDIKSIQCSKRVNPLFLVFVLKHNEKRLLQLARGANTEGLTLPMLESIPVPNVPLPLQEQFACIIQKFERVRRQQREATRQAEHLFQTLLHRAFRGEL